MDDDSDDEQQADKGETGELVIPPTHKSRVDSKGIQIITSYHANPGNPSQLLKTVTKQRVTFLKTRQQKDVEKCRKWEKFGQAALGEDTSTVTIRSSEDIMMEDPHADADLQDEDPGKVLAANLNTFWAKQQLRQLERKYDVDTPGKGGDDAGGGWTQVGAGGTKPRLATMCCLRSMQDWLERPCRNVAPMT